MGCLSGALVKTTTRAGLDASDCPVSSLFDLSL